MVLCYPGKLNITTAVLRRGWQESQSEKMLRKKQRGWRETEREGHRGKGRWRGRKRLKDSLKMEALKMEEGATNQEMQLASRS